LKRFHARQGSPATRGTRLGGIAFYHANGLRRAIPNSRGEINRESMVARGEVFRSYHLPVLSAEQNDSQSEEINVIDESQAENRPVPVQEAEIRFLCFFGRPFCLCLAAAQKIAHAAHSPSRLGELHVKAGFVSTFLFNINFLLMPVVILLLIFKSTQHSHGSYEI